MAGLVELENYTGQLLDVARFRDYSPNGLQVEGRPQVTHLASGVTASIALLEAALAAGADAILVHHGYFWRNEPAAIVGAKRRRLALLLQNDVSLLAYHLPLDAHAELGNNAQLGSLLGFQVEGWFGEQNIAAHGRLPQPLPLSALAADIERKLARTPLVIGDAAATVARIAWCSGAAQDYLAEAARLGVDAFVTGEISEHTVHFARESGVAFIAAGHHATERYGVKALGDHLGAHFGMKHTFIDIPNPV